MTELSNILHLFLEAKKHFYFYHLKSSGIHFCVDVQLEFLSTFILKEKFSL